MRLRRKPSKKFEILVRCCCSRALHRGKFVMVIARSAGVGDPGSQLLITDYSGIRESGADAASGENVERPLVLLWLWLWL